MGRGVPHIYPRFLGFQAQQGRTEANCKVESTQVTQERRGGTPWGKQAGSEQVKREPALWKEDGGETGGKR